MRTLILLTVTCLMASVTAACRRQAPAAETRIVFAMESEPERLSPLTIQNPQTIRVAWQIYEGLLGLTEDGQIAGRLAESWTTADSKTWRFRLREGVRFHASDLFGSPEATREVTADDVVWSYAAFCAPGAYAFFVLADSVEGCAAYNAGKASTVSGLRVVDPRTVEVRLLQPEPFFLNRITTALIAVFPKESAAPTFKERWGLSMAVGTGPFRLVSRTDTEVVLERNPEYWDAARRPQIGQLVFRVIKNEQVRLAELSRGSVDIMTVTPPLLPTIVGQDGQLAEAYRSRFLLKAYPTFNHHLIGINLARVPDLELRRAMSLGTDREMITRRLLYGFADVTGGAVPPAMHGYQPIIEKPLYRLEEARAAVRRSKYKGESLELVVHDLASSEQIGTVFQQQMKDIGIKITLTKLDFGSAIGRVVKGEVTLFSLFAEIVFSSPEPLLLNLFSSAKIPVPNFWKLSSPAVDSALESLRGMSDPAARLRRSAEIERDVIAQHPAIFLYSQRQFLVHSNRIASLPVNPHDHYELERLQLAR